MRTVSILNKTLAGAVFLGLGMSAAHAGESAIAAADNTIGIAATGTLMNYQEHITPGPSDTESGWMPGFDLRLGGLNPSWAPGLYWAIHYQYSSGNLQYQGAFMDGTPISGVDATSTDRVLARLGLAFPLTQNWQVSPYLAGGYQAWQRDLLGIGGYDETYGAGLIGAGLLIQTSPFPRWVFGLDTQALAVVGGQVSSTGLAPFPVRIDFGTSGEERIALHADYRLQGPWHLFAGTAFTHFTYTGGNNALAQLAEPSSSTNQWLSEVGLAYRY